MHLTQREKTAPERFWGRQRQNLPQRSLKPPQRSPVRSRVAVWRGHRGPKARQREGSYGEKGRISGVFALYEQG